MHTITLINEKGGCGKTLLAVHLAAGLALRGNRVVLIDADPQGSATLSLGIPPAPGFYTLMTHYPDWGELLVQAEPEHYGLKGTGELWVLPGNIRTTEIQPDDGLTITPFTLDTCLGDLADWADFVIVDTSPAPGFIHQLAYMATDSVILPTNPSLLSVHGLANTVSHIRAASPPRAEYDGRPPVNIMGVVPTMYRRDTEAHDVGVQQLAAQFKRALWPCVPLRTFFEKATWLQQTIFRYKPRSLAAGEMWALVERVEES